MSDRTDEISELRAANLVLLANNTKLRRQRNELRLAIRQCLAENAHLADGEDCTLMDAGMNHTDANAAADRLMRHLFGVVNYTAPNNRSEPTARTAR